MTNYLHLLVYSIINFYGNTKIAMIDGNTHTRIVMIEGTEQPICRKNDYMFHERLQSGTNKLCLHKIDNKATSNIPQLLIGIVISSFFSCYENITGDRMV